MEIKEARAYGVVFHDFKVPRGSLFGNTHGYFFVVQHSGHAWLLDRDEKAASWYSWPCYTSKTRQTAAEKLPADSRRVNACLAIAQAVRRHTAKNGSLQVESYRGPYWEPLLKEVTPRERRPGQYLYRAKPVEATETYGGYSISRDPAADRPVIPDEEFYSKTGKLENRYAHKPAGTREKPTQKKGSWVKSVTVTHAGKTVYREEY